MVVKVARRDRQCRQGTEGWPPSWRGRVAAKSATALTRDLLVTYCVRVENDDLVFKALADPTRRHLLDLLFERDGRTLTELVAEVEMTRFGVMKHLSLLVAAGLVLTRRSGREKLHFLNPVPIRLIHDRWIGKYRERQVSALATLKSELEGRE
jgi:DNA-binding transcriptional ArsR family regulator